MKKKSYTSLVWDQTRKETRSYYSKDQRGWIYNIGSAFLVAIISPIIYSLMGLIAPNQFLLSVLAGIVSGLAFFAIWVLFVLAGNTIRSTEILYREQEAKANLHTWKDVDIDVYYFPLYEMIGVGLSVASNKPSDTLIRGYGKVLSLVSGQTEIYKDRLPQQMPSVVYSENRPILRWDGGDIRDYKLAIAGWNDTQAFIYTEDGNNDLVLEVDKEYVITMVMHGTLFLTGHDLIDSILRYKLKYTKDKNDSQMKVFVELLERIQIQ